MGEFEEVAAGVRARVKEAFGAPSPATLWRLRSELLLLRAHLDRKDRGTDLRAAVDGVLALAGSTHALLVELRASLSDKAFARFATLLDLGAIGGLALDNLLSAEKNRLRHLLLSGLSELFTALAAWQYLKGADQRLAAVAQAQAARLQDEVWATLSRYRPRATAAELREAQQTVDRFFQSLLADGVPPEAQVAFVAGAHQILLRLRCVELLQLLPRPTVK